MRSLSFADGSRGAGDSKRILLERIERIRRCNQAARDSGEFVEPHHTIEEVKEMLHTHLEESRIRREENEKRIAERRWASRYSASRF